MTGEIIVGGETMNSGSRLAPKRRTLNAVDCHEEGKVSSIYSDDSSLIANLASLRVDS